MLPTEYRSFVESLIPHIVTLFSEKWGIDIKYYCLTDLESLSLQSYPIRPPKYRQEGVNVIVHKESLSWTPLYERHTIPPRDSKESNDYIAFYKQTGTGLKIIPKVLKEIEMVRTPFVLDSIEIMIGKPREITLLAYNATLGKYSQQDIESSRWVEWKEKFREIERASREKGDTELANLCSQLLSETN